MPDKEWTRVKVKNPELESESKVSTKFWIGGDVKNLIRWRLDVNFLYPRLRAICARYKIFTYLPAHSQGKAVQVKKEDLFAFGCQHNYKILERENTSMNEKLKWWHKKDWVTCFPSKLWIFLAHKFPNLADPIQYQMIGSIFQKMSS